MQRGMIQPWSPDSRTPCRVRALKRWGCCHTPLRARSLQIASFPQAGAKRMYARAAGTRASRQAGTRESVAFTPFGHAIRTTGYGRNMSPVPLAIGVALSLLTSVVRTRGWFATVQAACPETSTLRYRDVLRAYFSGAGFNGLVPGRPGEAVKLAVLRRYVPEARYSTLAATLAPPAAVESGFSAAVL